MELRELARLSSVDLDGCWMMECDRWDCMARMRSGKAMDGFEDEDG